MKDTQLIELDSSIKIQQCKKIYINKYQNIICVQDFQNQLHFIDPFTKQLFLSIKTNFDNIIQLDFSKNTNFIVIQTQDFLLFYDIINNRIKYEFKIEQPVLQYEMDHFSKHLALMNYKGKSCLYNFKQKEEIEILNTQYSRLSFTSQKDTKQIIYFEKAEIRLIELIQNRFKTLSQSLFKFYQPINRLLLFKFTIILDTDEKFIIYQIKTKELQSINKFFQNLQQINSKIPNFQKKQISINIFSKYNQVTDSIVQQQQDDFLFDFDDNFLVFYSQNHINYYFYKNKQFINHYISNKIQSLKIIKYWDFSLLFSQDKLKVLTFIGIEQWVAFGYKFQAIKTNEEYMELEDEFDEKKEERKFQQIDVGLKTKKVELKNALIGFQL